MTDAFGEQGHLSDLLELIDCWDYLKSVYASGRPIFVYGMGLGAEKILAVFEQYQIEVSGFFASNDFVRGHSFKGHQVMRLADIEAEHDDFVVVLAFAAGYEELYDRILDIASRHELVAPDVPVAGGGLFNKEFFQTHLEKFQQVYSNLADDLSRTVYRNILAFKLTGRPEFLAPATTVRSEIYTNLIASYCKQVAPDTRDANDINDTNDTVDKLSFVDMGAYKGDTIEEFLSYYGENYGDIYAFEPNSKNYTKMCNNLESKNITRLHAYNACAWKESCEVTFTANEGRMARISTSADSTMKLMQNNMEMQAQALKATKTAAALAIDDVIKIEEDASSDNSNNHDNFSKYLLKLDVEGVEDEAIDGASKLIRTAKPAIICALYHRNEDMFAIPLKLLAMNPDYELYVRHELYIPAWETNLIALP